MSRKNKVVMMARTKEGFMTKVWINRKTEQVLPTNWKIQAAILGITRPVPRG